MIFIIFIAVMVLSFTVQQGLQVKFNKYSKVRTPDGMTGADIARKMLADNGINDVEVACIPGTLTDHYDPGKKLINLSENVYSQCSIAAAAVAAHETGHAIQHQQGYAPLRLRTAMVPVVQFASTTVQWVLLLGILLINIFPGLFWGGVGLFALTTLFSFITLPVEINASSRAVEWLDHSRITYGETHDMAVDALRQAAYTYVIAALGSLATLLYYISIANRR